MPQFELEIHLPVSPGQLSSDLLSMTGVNYELSPMLQMSAPEPWALQSISEWPTNKDIFTSKISLFGLIPIDFHHFKFLSVHSQGFKESSKSLFNNLWSHERTISSSDSGSKVKDVVYYKSKLGWVGYVFKPVYKSIFIHRHKRLKSKYAKNNREFYEDE